MQKYSPFEIALKFDQQFATFILTKFHGLQNLWNTINVKFLLRTYDDEDAYNFELSYTYKDKTKFLSLNSFYLHRVNPQIRLSYQLDPANPSSFDFYTVNTKEGYSYGFEGEFRTMITDRLYFYDSFAMLKSYISSFEFLGNSVGNRTEAHAPEFSASWGFEYTMKSGIYMKFDHSVMFDFYHEDQYESKTDPFQILSKVFGWRKIR